jgi:hypothetical protein
MDIEDAMALIYAEYLRASAKYPAMHSAHEAIAVIEEEFNELRAEVFTNHSLRSNARMRTEAMHLGAMALRFLVDLCPGELSQQSVLTGLDTAIEK